MMLRCPDGSWADLSPADVICTHAHALFDGDSAACRAAIQAARGCDADPRDAILVRLRNGWRVVAFEADPTLRDELVRAIAAAKAEQIPIVDVANLRAALLEDKIA